MWPLGRDALLRVQAARKRGPPQPFARTRRGRVPTRICHISALFSAFPVGTFPRNVRLSESPGMGAKKENGRKSIGYYRIYRSFRQNRITLREKGSARVAENGRARLRPRRQKESGRESGASAAVKSEKRKVKRGSGTGVHFPRRRENGGREVFAGRGERAVECGDDALAVGRRRGRRRHSGRKAKNEREGSLDLREGGEKERMSSDLFVRNA